MVFKVVTHGVEDGVSTEEGMRGFWESDNDSWPGGGYTGNSLNSMSCTCFVHCNECMWYFIIKRLDFILKT